MPVIAITLYMERLSNRPLSTRNAPLRSLRLQSAERRALRFRPLLLRLRLTLQTPAIDASKSEVNYDSDDVRCSLVSCVMR